MADECILRQFIEAIATIPFLVPVTAVVFLVVYVWLYDGRISNIPRGPRGIPFLGNIDTPTADAIDFREISKTYGGIYSLKYIRRFVVYIHDHDIIREMLIDKADIFCQRPSMFVVEHTLNQSDVVTFNGPRWQEKRKFLIRNLRHLGFGRSEMEEAIANEAKILVQQLRQYDGKELLVHSTFRVALLNTLWKITAGKTYDINDDKIRKFVDVVNANFDSLAKIMPLNIVPWLRFLPGDFFAFKKFMGEHRETKAFYQSEVDEHLKTFQHGHQRDFIDIYLSKIKEQSPEELKDKDNVYTHFHLLGALDNLFIAGSETTATFLEWAILYLALWPEFQEKIQKELDEVVGSHRAPTMEDYQHCVYTVAFIQEAYRYSTVVPVTIHKPTRTTTVKGYVIPKGTWIFHNLWAMHHNEKYFEEPEVFRPERFIDADGKIVKSKYLLPFNFGPRVCFGEPMSRQAIFLFLTYILQNFTLGRAIGKPPPTLKAFISLARKPFPYVIVPRLRKNTTN